MDKMNGISKLNSVSRVLKLPIRKEEQNIIKTPSVSNKGIMLTSPVPFGLYHFSGRITLGVSIGILLFLFLVIMSRELEIILAGIGGCIAIILMFFSWDKGESIKRIGDFSFSLPINMVPEQF